jgi:hypothetical protein
MLDPKAIRDLLDYDPETGRLVWRKRGPEWFRDGVRSSAYAQSVSWNKRFAGREALTARVNGYLVGMLLGKGIRAHRAAFAWMTGEWPPEEIDHIDGNRANNTWANLRPASKSVNGKNQQRHSTNSSGTAGVSFDRRNKSWRARITVNGRLIYLGRFKSLEDAAAARKWAEAAFGFHENHGRAA